MMQELGQTFHLIETSGAFTSLVDELGKHSRLAVDTEIE